MSDASDVLIKTIAAVGSEAVLSILKHGTLTAPAMAIPPDLRAQVRDILFPLGGNKLAVEVEHERDLAQLAALGAASTPLVAPLAAVHAAAASVPGGASNGR